ncbi:MAG: hypothetical protein CVU18_10750 [Betaproteobacteria bacterium HGW-Betaproteobacteria-12]|nr:MAG: hypothetical protein CVU18_10750 [Betaproteobacteria bacterium HGW-Betaproteobacteria-12]
MGSPLVSDHSLICRSLLVQWLLARLFPRLRQWPVRQWPELLAKAKSIEFDRFEQIGTLAGVLLVTALLQPATSTETSVLVAYLFQLLLALPLLLLILGPFFLRRIRRGLEQIASKDHAPPAENR